MRIYISCGAGVRPDEFSAVASGVQELAAMSGRAIGIARVGCWRGSDYLNANGSLRAWQSIDWFVAVSRERGRVNAERFLLKLHQEPVRQVDPHQDVVLLSDDLLSPDYNFVAGLSNASVGAVLSTFRLSSMGQDSIGRLEALKTLAMHEFGHVLQLPCDRNQVLERGSSAPHCNNRCVMRPCCAVPHDLEVMTRDRLRFGALCSDCLREITRND